MYSLYCLGRGRGRLRIILIYILCKAPLSTLWILARYKFIYSLFIYSLLHILCYWLDRIMSSVYFFLFFSFFLFCCCCCCCCLFCIVTHRSCCVLIPKWARTNTKSSFFPVFPQAGRGHHHCVLQSGS